MTESRIEVLDKGHVALLDAMPMIGGDRVIAETALMTRAHEIKGDAHVRRVLTDLICKGHKSPFEQVQFRFEVKCPLFVRSQWMRHRTQSYMETSRRHITTAPEFYNPGGKHASDYDYVHYGFALNAYRNLLDAGEPPERARMILPTAMYTTFVTSVNAKNLLDFLRQRLAKDAQWETRQYALAVHKLMSQVLPITSRILKGMKW